MEIKDLKLKIIELIAKDELDKAVKMLQENVPMNHPSYVGLVMQMRRLNDLRKQTNNATIAFEEAARERNKISQSLIEMTQALTPPPPPPKENHTTFSDAKTETPSIGALPKYQDDLLDDYDEDLDDSYENELDEMNFDSSSRGLQGYQNEIFFKGSPAMEEETIVLAKSYDMTFLKCVQAINYNNFTLQQQNQKAGYIKATTGISIWSFGEEIHIYIKELDGLKTLVHIICDSAVKTTVTSWGKNAKNIEKILTILKQR